MMKIDICRANSLKGACWMTAVKPAHRDQKREQIMLILIKLSSDTHFMALQMRTRIIHNDLVKILVTDLQMKSSVAEGRRSRSLSPEAVRFFLASSV